MLNIFVLLWLLTATILGQIIIFFIGFTFYYLIFRNTTFPTIQKLSIYYGLGTGVLGLFMFISICLSLHSRLSFLPILLVTFCIFLKLKCFNTVKKEIKEIFKIFKNLKFNYLELFCVLILMIEFTLMISYWYTYPIISWDAWVIWDSKARFIFFDGNFNYIIKNDEVQNAHADYPILQPLNYCFFYTLMFQPHHFATIIHLSYFGFLLLFLYYSLRNFNLDRSYSILIITAIATYPSFVGYTIVAYADPVLTFFYTISTVLLYYFITTKKESFLILSSIFTGFMAWSKNEGLGLLVINVSIFILYNLYLLIKKKLVFKKTIAYCMVFFSVGFIIYLPWILMCLINNISNDYTSNIPLLFDTKKTIANFSIIIDKVIKIHYTMFLLWIAFYISLFINIKAIFKAERFFLLILIIFHYLLYIAIYLITPFALEWQIDSSFDREILHLVPISLFFIGILLAENKQFLIDFEKKERMSYKFLVYTFLIINLIFIILDIFYIHLASEIIRKIKQGIYLLYKFY